MTEADVGPYVGLIRDLCANEGPEAAEWVLDLLALIVGEPGVKPGFGLLLQSEVQGLGKDLILVPVIRAVGEDNCAQPSLGEVTEKFNPWAARQARRGERSRTQYAWDADDAGLLCDDQALHAECIDNHRYPGPGTQVPGAERIGLGHHRQPG